MRKRTDSYYLLSLGCSKNTVDSESMARLLEGEALPDPQAFARRLEGMISKGVAPSGG